MPIPKGAQVRVKNYRSGKRVRLIIRDGKVIDTEKMSPKRKR